MKAVQLSLFGEEADAPKPKKKKHKNPLLGPKIRHIG